MVGPQLNMSLQSHLFNFLRCSALGHLDRDLLILRNVLDFVSRNLVHVAICERNNDQQRLRERRVYTPDLSVRFCIRV